MCDLTEFQLRSRRVTVYCLYTHIITQSEVSWAQKVHTALD